MPNRGQLGGFRLSPAPTSRFWRQVPLSGEESPPQHPRHIRENAKYASQLPFSREPRPMCTARSDDFSGRLHRL
jgi:hypothetical protein